MNSNKKKKQFFSNRNIIWLATIIIIIFFMIQNISAVLSGMKFIISLLFPFLLGAAIAFVMNVPMKSIEEKWFKRWQKHTKLKRPLAYIITLLLIIAVIFIALFIIIPELYHTVNNLVEQVPAAFENVKAWFFDLQKYLPHIQQFTDGMTINWDKMTQDAVVLLQNAVGGLFNSTASIVSGIISSIANFFIAFVFSIYILFQKETLTRQFTKLFYACLPKKVAVKTIDILQLANTTFSNFLSGQCTEAIILGFLFFVTMSIIRLPYALLMGVLIAITALIPIFGAFIGLGVGFFLIVVVNPMQALLFAILFLVLQQLEGNLIYPYVVGGTVGLPSIWVLVAVTFGGKTMGILGMLLFIPIASVCYALLGEYISGKTIKKEKTVKRKNVKIVDEKIIEEVDYDKM